jgi:hypothetical protein
MRNGLSAAVRVALAVGAVVLPAPSLRGVGAIQAEAAFAYRGFTLSPGSCGATQRRCGLQGPKNWTAEEVKSLEKAIDEILGHPDGQRVVTGAQQRGASELRRYAIAVSNTLEAEPGIAAGRVRGATWSGIQFYDAGMDSLDARDQFSGKPGYLLLAGALLHECFHAVDELSKEPEFAKLAGFRSAGATWRFAFSEQDFALLTRFREYVRTQRIVDLADEWRLSRRFALSMRPIRVPTARSTDNPAEAFASIGAHLILDPKARTYLPREVVGYFDTKVFGRPVSN